MFITKWMRKEASGLAHTTLELAKATEDLGHRVCIRQPHDGMPIYGPTDKVDIHTIHSQLHPDVYHDGKPKFTWMHGEALSSVANGISMRALLDLAPLCEAFIVMRREEVSIWKDVKRTYYVPKGIDLERYAPQPGITERLSGEPAVLYVENWRGMRNPLYIMIAMAEVHKKFPKARLHLYNVQDKNMHDAFKGFIDAAKYATFVRSLQGPVDDVPLLMNRVDIVVSALHPLYARTPLEALGCGKAAICAGYQETDYPWHVDNYSPEGFASAIIKCWENYDKINYRAYAEKHHDVKDTIKQAVTIYERYL